METQFCALASGSSGNCHVLACGKETLLIDAGLSGRQIVQRMEKAGMDPADLTGILVSHEHRDHIHGAGILSRRFDIPVYANVKTWTAMENQLSPLPSAHQRIFDSDRPFSIGEVQITPYRLSHDAEEPVGFVLETPGRKICIATDLGIEPKGFHQLVQNADLVVMESNHDVQMLQVGKYPYALKRRILSDKGHLSNETAGSLIGRMINVNVSAVLLAHLSQENNFPELALSTVVGVLAEKGIVPGRDLTLDVSLRNRASGLYHFDTGR